MHKLAVKLEGMERHRRSTPLMHLSAAVFLLAKALDYIHHYRFQNTVSAIPFFVVVGLSLLYGFRMKKWDAEGRYNPWLRLVQAGSFTILGLLFLNIEGVVDEVVAFLWAAICFFLWSSEKRNFKRLYLTFGQEGISIPGFYGDKWLAWNEIKDVVARPDFITIFKKNNQYLQLELQQNESETHLNDINRFSKTRIQQNK